MRSHADLDQPKELYRHQSESICEEFSEPDLLIRW
jgi:hypothetical protein